MEPSLVEELRPLSPRSGRPCGLLRLLPTEVVAALDRWDPERRALVLSPMFNELPEIAGRRVYEPRRPE
jgi:hypothetical protein